MKIPDDLRELRVLGQTLWRRRADILAYFDTGASNGPVENFNGKLEHLRGIALGFFEQGQRHLAAIDLLGRTPRGNQRTPKPEEPLKSDYRYSGGVVYNNFIWSDLSQPDGESKRSTVEATDQAVLDARAQYSDSTIAEMYDPDNDLLFPDLTSAHRSLDAAVESAYGVNLDGDEQRIVEHLCTLPLPPENKARTKPHPSTKQQQTLPAARRPSRWTSCASCLPSAFPAASSYARCRHHSTWKGHPYAKRGYSYGR